MHGGIGGKQGVHNRVSVRQDFLHIVLNGFRIDPHMTGSMTILCDARRIDLCISGESRQRVVARDNHTNIGVSANSTCLVQGLVGVIGALYMLRITEVNVFGCLVRHRIATLGSQARSIGAVISECHPSHPAVCSQWR